MYPIIINRNAQMVSYEKVFILNDRWLSFEELCKYVTKKETFYIDYEEMKIHVNGKRLETDKETKTRVEREETYMKNYNEYHKNKKH